MESHDTGDFLKGEGMRPKSRAFQLPRKRLKKLFNLEKNAIVLHSFRKSVCMEILEMRDAFFLWCEQRPSVEQATGVTLKRSEKRMGL